jgi:hypothetical protein
MAGQPGWPKDIVTIYIDSFNIPQFPKILSIDPYYPNFKYMSNDIFRSSQANVDNWKSIATNIYYFNRVFDGTGSLIPFGKYVGSYSLELIKKFCIDSDKELCVDEF